MALSRKPFGMGHMFIKKFFLEWPILWPPRIMSFPPGTTCIYSSSKLNLQSEARRQQSFRVEFNNLPSLKIIPDKANISICMQNHWAWGGSWLYYTKHVQPVRCINIRYCNEWLVQFMGERFICQNCIVLYHNLTFCSHCWSMPWAVWVLAVAHRTVKNAKRSIPYTANCPTQCCAVRQMPAVNCQ
jgi:hypothetical protein